MNIRIFLFVLFGSVVLYMLIIFAFTEGWTRLSRHAFSLRDLSTPVSVVIPFRNEAASLKTLIKALCEQTYPADLVEIILVDDHSEDNGKILIENLIRENHVNHIRIIDTKKTGKKAALRTGILQAGGKLIVTTDADCIPTKNWLTEIVTLYEEKKSRLILGPVVYGRENTFLQKLFSLDFISLVASGAGSTGLGLPFMGNAANMAFEKQVYIDAEDHAMNTGFASGDDVFFIHYVRREYGRNAIEFIKNEKTIVHTSTPENLKAFLLQRIRWGSKARAYTQSWALLVSYSIFLFNFLLSVVLIAGFFVPWFFIIYFLFIILKTLIDFPLLFAFCRFSRKRYLLPYVFALEPVYPLYITYVAFRGLFPFEWKNRYLSR